ncbi:MAG: helix-turn-helix domain-containing protein [Proteobacteria bacterium]|nr:helix-turn-helix domain-containing protein [Pseudomonadota bacterium]
MWLSGAAALAAPRWYLWEGGFLVVGQAGGEVPAHAHHAIQLFVALDGVATIRAAGGAWREGQAIIVRPDVEHSFNAQGSTGAMIFVDPESSEGVWLQSALTADLTIAPRARVQACSGELRTFLERPLEGLDAGSLVRHCVLAFCAGSPPSRRFDPRVATILRRIREADDLRYALEAAAGLVHLSPGRFAHLFKEQLGLPFRRYMLWRKLTRAMLAIGREANLAAAAQASDFADAAHLTRTFNQMFGIPPSVLMRGDFFEIPSPFAPAS